MTCSEGKSRFTIGNTGSGDAIGFMRGAKTAAWRVALTGDK